MPDAAPAPSSRPGASAGVTPRTGACNCGGGFPPSDTWLPCWGVPAGALENYGHEDSVPLRASAAPSSGKTDLGNLDCWCAAISPDQHPGYVGTSGCASTLRCVMLISAWSVAARLTGRGDSTLQPPTGKRPRATPRGKAETPPQQQRRRRPRRGGGGAGGAPPPRGAPPPPPTAGSSLHRAGRARTRPAEDTCDSLSFMNLSP